MANVAALLAQYQAVKSQISFYTLEQLKWQELHDSMTEKVGTWRKYEEKWNDASNDYCDKHDENGKFIKLGTTWLWTSSSSGTISYKYHNTMNACGPYAKKEAAWNGWGAYLSNRDEIGSFYADKVCPQFAKDGADKLEEYTNLDMEYEAMQTTYETMLTSLRAQEESLKTAVDEGAKDTGMSSGG